MSDIQQILCYKPQNINPKNSSKIYFACHPSEFNLYFDEVFNDVIGTAQKSGITCTLWYRNPEITLTESDSEPLLSQVAEMQLVVVPITKALLEDPSTVIEKEIALAKSKNIPILPLLDDSELISVYSRPEFFGDTQFLSKNIPDATALPFDKKLSNFLTATLVGDEMREKIQAEFDAYIFLSYRKKDRAAAQELMRLIHKNDFCRDIAIWYDEFLTPGENFTQAIKDALDKSALFTLVVTPNITEPNNYVLEHEYPMAQKAKKPILPVESIPTDRTELEQSFDNLPKVADAHNPLELSEALLEKLKKLAIRENDTPYHNYLIGLAYLNGIDVEVDSKKAEELLTLAANGELPEAMMTLSDIYKTGKGVPRDYQKSLEWLERATSLYIQRNFEESGKYVNEVINALTLLASYYLNFGDDRNAERYSLEAAMYCRNEFKKTNNEQFIDTGVSNYIMLIQARTNLFFKQNPNINAAEVYKFSLSLYEKAAEYIEECGLSPEQLKKIGKSAGLIYNQLSILMLTLSADKEKAQEYQNKAVELMEINGELRSVLGVFFNKLSDGSLDFDGYMEMLDRIFVEADMELSSVAESQKQTYLVAFLAATASLPGITSNFAAAFEDEPDKLDKIRVFLYRYINFFNNLDIPKLDNDSLISLSKACSTVSEFEHCYGDTEKAKILNLTTLQLAQKSFELYPTQKAFSYWMAAVNDASFMDPSLKLNKELWLHFEEIWNKVYNDPREPLNGLVYLETIYNNLLVIAEQNEDCEEFGAYSSKAYDLAAKRFRHSNTIDNEIKLLEAQRKLLMADFRCDKPISNMDMAKIINRCADLLNNSKEQNLNNEQYHKTLTIYCYTIYLLGTLCATEESFDDAVKYINIFLETVPNCNKNGEFDDDIESAKNILLMIELYKNTPEGSDEEEE